jgi:tRNA(fMet)-specific endonuclease VapC
MWMLDTNTCSYAMRRHPARVKARFDQVGHTHLAISTLVLAELFYGAARHPTRSEAYFAEIADFSRRLRVVPWSEVAALGYARIRAELERRGAPIGNMDLLIAAHALAEKAVLVTHNTREFERVPGLVVENWV